MKLSKYLETLEGKEISSIHYEGVCGVRNGKVIQLGEIIDVLNLKKAKSLFDELMVQEGIANISGNIDQCYIDEFAEYQKTGVF